MTRSAAIRMIKKSGYSSNLITHEPNLHQSVLKYTLMRAS
jgi:hypothetical protein